MRDATRVALCDTLLIMNQPLAALLNVSSPTIVRRLRPLYSVLRFPADSETPIRTLHLSFREFLLNDEPRHERFGVDGSATPNALHEMSGIAVRP